MRGKNAGTSTRRHPSDVATATKAAPSPAPASYQFQVHSLGLLTQRHDPRQGRQPRLLVGTWWEDPRQPREKRWHAKTVVATIHP